MARTNRLGDLDDDTIATDEYGRLINDPRNNNNNLPPPAQNGELFVDPPIPAEQQFVFIPLSLLMPPVPPAIPPAPPMPPAPPAIPPAPPMPPAPPRVYNLNRPRSNPILSSNLLNKLIFITILVAIFIMWLNVKGANDTENKVSNSYQNQQMPLAGQTVEQPLEIKELSDIAVVRRVHDRLENTTTVNLQEIHQDNIAVCARFKVLNNNPDNRKTNLRLEVYGKGTRVNYAIFEIVPKYGTTCLQLPKITTSGEYEVKLSVLDRVGSTVFTVKDTTEELPKVIRTIPQEPRYDSEQRISRDITNKQELVGEDSHENRWAKAKGPKSSKTHQETVKTWGKAHNEAVYIDD